MQAFVIDEPGKFSITETYKKPTITVGDVLVQIKKVGFCGSDLNTFRGLNPLVSYPRIPGHEIAAEIVECGKNVPQNFQVGDKVLVLPYTTCASCSSCLNNKPNACKYNQTMGVQKDGGMTELLAVPHEKLIGKINELSFSEIAMVEPLAVGFHAGARAVPQKGEKMLVFGCGLVGLGAIARGYLCGADVIAVDIDDEKLELAKQFGAKYAINSKSCDLHEEVMKLTDDHGPAVVVEAIGLNETFIAAVDLVSFSGRVVFVGYVKNPVEFETKNFVMKELQIMGSRNALAQDFSDVLKAMENENFPIDALISKDVPLSDAGEALAEWSDNPSKISKILVSFD